MRIALTFLLVCSTAFAVPNGYFRLNSDGTIDMITSRVLCDDMEIANDLSITGGVTTVDTIQMDITFEDGVSEGRIQWNSEDGTLEYGMPGGNVNLQIGQENLVKATNKTGTTISNGTPVYVSGAQGSRPTIAPADADDIDKHHVCGIATETISNNNSGYICSFGLVRDVDTSEWTAGDHLYISTEAGQLTNGIPAYPAEAMCVGVVLFSNAESGIILANPQHELTFDLLAETPLKVYSIEYTATNLYTDLRFAANSINLAGLPNPADVELWKAGYPQVVAKYDNTGNENLFFTVQMPHDYKTGTVLKPHLHTISDSSAVTSNWALVYSYADIGEVFSAPQTNLFTTITSGVDGEHELFNAGDMPGLGTEGEDVSAMIGIELRRLSGGTATDCNVFEFDIHYVVGFGGGQPYP